jgi:hypothetical protein
MKLVYVVLLLVLIASLMGLEVFASRVPYESLMPSEADRPGVNASVPGR